MRLVDITGQKFGKLTVLKKVEKPKHLKKNETFWLCKCDCGNEKVIRGYSLKVGNTTSCGCYFQEKMSTHKLSKHPLYYIRRSIIQRCCNENSASYYLYGARGIQVCDEWKNDFEAFYQWAIENGYNEEKLLSGRNKLTLDRIDNNGNYEPSNCRWVTQKVQGNNTRKNHLITINGETKTMQMWCDLYHINKKAFYCRVKSGKVGEELIAPLKEKVRKEL